MKKAISMILTSVMAVSALSVSAGAVDYGAEYANQPTKTYTQKFNDVPTSHWAFSYIGEMTEREVVSGYPNGNFYPDNNVTRAEFARIMTSASGLQISLPTQRDFSDVATDAWYAPYIHAAYPYLSGYQIYGGSYYKPDTPALREDIAVALVKLKGYDTLGADESLLTTMFTDANSISGDAKKYVAVALERGLVSGYEDNTFRGQASISRAEATAMLWRAYQYGNDNKTFDNIPTTAPITPTASPIATQAPAIATPKPVETEKPVVTTVPTEKPTPEPTEPPQYSFELKTLINNVDNVSQMVVADDRIIYLDENRIMSFEYNGSNLECIFDADDLEYLKDEDLTKEQLTKIETDIHAIGYNEYDNCIYAIVTQESGYKPLYMIYNVTHGEKTGSFYEYWNSEGSNYPLSESKLIMDFNKNGEFCIGGDLSGSTVAGVAEEDYLIDAHKDVNEPDDFVHTWQTYFLGNTRLKIRGNKVYVMSNRTGDWENVDFYCEELGNGTFFAVSNDEKIYYQVSSSYGKEGIFSVNLNGDDYVICYVDDIDNTDEKIIRLDAIKRGTSAVDENGVIYYWDSNYNCIRQLEHK